MKVSSHQFRIDRTRAWLAAKNSATRIVLNAATAAALIVATPMSFAGTDDVGGFQSISDIAAAVRSGGGISQGGVASSSINDATGIQSVRDVQPAPSAVLPSREHSGTAFGVAAPEATGIQSVRDIL